MNDLQMKSQEKEGTMTIVEAIPFDDDVSKPLAITKNEVIVASDKDEREEAKESTDAMDDMALEQSTAKTNDVINISDEAAQYELLVIPDAVPLLAEVSVLSCLVNFLWRSSVPPIVNFLPI